MAANDKDTIYIDIDDEITGIIDKLKGSDGKIVALILPKRAAVFQSIVNMKLLKRAADGASKHLVLITSEAGLLPLAGASGIHVAKTLTSKPEIPSGPDNPSDDEEAVAEDDDEAIDPKTAGNRPVGELAGATAVAAAAKRPSDDMETLELDDEDVPPEDGGKPKDSKPKPKKDKKLRIPNFDRFRLLMVLGVLALILLIAGLVFANTHLSRATINIATDASTVNAGADLNLSTTATSFDPNGNVMPAKLVTQQKTYSQQVATTGQKNNGNKASGTITVTNCGPDDQVIPAGTGFKSSGGNTYISQKAFAIPVSDFTSPQTGSQCKNNGKADVNVTAQSAGTSFNAPANTSYSVAYGTGLTGVGGTMSGGTDDIVQSVNQNDINNAKAKITPSDADVKQMLQTQLQQAGNFPVLATYVAGAPAISQSANVGDTVNNVTVTEVITYTMFGVHKADLQTVIKTDVEGQIDTAKQTILDDGLNKATFTVNDISATGAKISLASKVTVGPDLDVNTIKKEAAGQHAGEIKARLGSNPDVTGVEVKLSPFWVSTVPKNPKQITVNIAKPKASTSKAHASNP